MLWVKNIILLPLHHKGFNLFGLLKLLCLIHILQLWLNGEIKKIITIFPEVSEFKKTEDVQQNLITSSNIYPITYKVRKDKNGNWLIINIIVNGVNLGLTFRNQFQALAKEHDENIDEIIKHWTSDANLD